MRTRTAPPEALARRTALSAVALLGVVPDAPVQLFSDDFQGVCQGATVACIEVTSEQMVRECTGYTRDNHDTNDKVTLNTATYTVTVHEATTGKVLGATELDGTDDTCPTVMTFDDDDQTKTYDAPPSTEDLIAFVKPFVQP